MGGARQIVYIVLCWGGRVCQHTKKRYVVGYVQTVEGLSYIRSFSLVVYMIVGTA